MTHEVRAALTPEQWEARDYRQVAGELDEWARGHGEAASDDKTEYVAKLGLAGNASVVIMNRAHDRVLVPPPARAALAAFALMDQPFGFTPADVRALRQAAERGSDSELAAQLRGIAQRIEALISPTGVT